MGQVGTVHSQTETGASRAGCRCWSGATMAGSAARPGPQPAGAHAGRKTGANRAQRLGISGPAACWARGSGTGSEWYQPQANRIDRPRDRIKASTRRNNISTTEHPNNALNKAPILVGFGTRSVQRWSAMARSQAGMCHPAHRCGALCNTHHGGFRSSQVIAKSLQICYVEVCHTLMIDFHIRTMSYSAVAGMGGMHRPDRAQFLLLPWSLIDRRYEGCRRQGRGGFSATPRGRALPLAAAAGRCLTGTLQANSPPEAKPRAAGGRAHAPSHTLQTLPPAGQGCLCMTELTD